MSENIHHIFESAEKDLIMSPAEVRLFVRGQLMPAAQERMKNTLIKFSTNTVEYLRATRNEAILDLAQSGESITLITMVMLDIGDCGRLFERYGIAVENPLLYTYLTNGLYTEKGDVALFNLLGDAGFTFAEVQQYFSESDEDTAESKMEKRVSLSRLKQVFKESGE